MAAIYTNREIIINMTNNVNKYMYTVSISTKIITIGAYNKVAKMNPPKNPSRICFRVKS